jgi:hypothetical protein
MNTKMKMFFGILFLIVHTSYASQTAADPEEAFYTHARAVGKKHFLDSIDVQVRTERKTECKNSDEKTLNVAPKQKDNAQQESSPSWLWTVASYFFRRR